MMLRLAAIALVFLTFSVWAGDEPTGAIQADHAEADAQRAINAIPEKAITVIKELVTPWTHSAKFPKRYHDLQVNEKTLNDLFVQLATLNEQETSLPQEWEAVSEDFVADMLLRSDANSRKKAIEECDARKKISGSDSPHRRGAQEEEIKPPRPVILFCDRLKTALAKLDDPASPFATKMADLKARRDKHIKAAALGNAVALRQLKDYVGDNSAVREAPATGEGVLEALAHLEENGERDTAKLLRKTYLADKRRFYFINADGNNVELTNLRSSDKYLTNLVQGLVGSGFKFRLRDGEQNPQEMREYRWDPSEQRLVPVPSAVLSQASVPATSGPVRVGEGQIPEVLEILRRVSGNNSYLFSPGDSLRRSGIEIFRNSLRTNDGKLVEALKSVGVGNAEEVARRVGEELKKSKKSQP